MFQIKYFHVKTQCLLTWLTLKNYSLCALVGRGLRAQAEYTCPRPARGAPAESPYLRARAPALLRGFPLWLRMIRFVLYKNMGFENWWKIYSLFEYIIHLMFLKTSYYCFLNFVIQNFQNLRKLLAWIWEGSISFVHLVTPLVFLDIDCGGNL